VPGTPNQRQRRAVGVHFIGHRAQSKSPSFLGRRFFAGIPVVSRKSFNQIFNCIVVIIVAFFSSVPVSVFAVDSGRPSFAGSLFDVSFSPSGSPRFRIELPIVRRRVRETVAWGRKFGRRPGHRVGNRPQKRDYSETRIHSQFMLGGQGFALQSCFCCDFAVKTASNPCRVPAKYCSVNRSADSSASSNCGVEMFESLALKCASRRQAVFDLLEREPTFGLVRSDGKVATTATCDRTSALRWPPSISGATKDEQIETTQSRKIVSYDRRHLATIRSNSARILRFRDPRNANHGRRLKGEEFHAARRDDDCSNCDGTVSKGQWRQIRASRTGEYSAV